ncbi:MAG: hypothetical protein JO309_03510 [Pseudonocardiales bacterium]|nr:hypothetical protein [Pseudonocardiales bacterium]
MLADQFSQRADADAVHAAQFQSQVQNIQQLAQSAHDLGSKPTPNSRATV